VVVNDAVSVYPFGVAVVDVLANDTDPGAPDGSALAFCRLPSMSSLFTDIDLPKVTIADSAGVYGPAGKLVVSANRRFRAPTDVEYYVCNETHMTEATLTVSMRETAPVTVRKIPGRPGRLKVVNHNDERVIVAWLGVREGTLDGAVRVPAHGTRTIRVDHKRIEWAAVIGNDRRSGIADHGAVRGIDVDPHRSKPSKGDAVKHVDIPGIVGLLFSRLR